MVKLISKNQLLASDENFINSFYKKKPTNCILYSKEGCRFMIHKEILGQTKLLRSILTSAKGFCCEDLEIFCPCSKDELKDMIGFFYEGRIQCNADTDHFVKILENLTKIFGFPKEFVDEWYVRFDVINEVCDKSQGFLQRQLCKRQLFRQKFNC